MFRQGTCSRDVHRQRTNGSPSLLVTVRNGNNRVSATSSKDAPRTVWLASDVGCLPTQTNKSMIRKYGIHGVFANEVAVPSVSKIAASGPCGLLQA